MAEIPCPVCDFQHDDGDYPDHGEGCVLTCDGCEVEFRIALIDWEPTFYTEVLRG